MSGNHKRVVITGIGVVSPLGMDAAITWQGLINGRSGIESVTLFDTSSSDTKIGGEVKGFEPTDFISRKQVRRIDRFAQLSVAAARQAVDDAGILLNGHNKDDIGTIVGSGIGGLSTLFQQAVVLQEKGANKVSPFLAPMMIADMGAAQVSIALELKGPNYCTTSACSSGSDAIGTAFAMVKHGEVDTMLAGGSESIINPLGFAAFNALKAITTRNDDPHAASRPFDSERDGFIISEGAGIVVLEEMETALNRGTRIYAEVLGYGHNSDAYHITAPDPAGEGAAACMRMALDDGGIGPEQVDYINAHGTSTTLNDISETRAIKSIFPEAGRIPVSSNKSMTGHMWGGAGGVETIFSALTITRGIIPPTINYQKPDPECDLDYVPNAARQVKVKVALSNSFGFGSTNGTLVLRQISA